MEYDKLEQSQTLDIQVTSEDIQTRQGIKLQEIRRTRTNTYI